MNVLRIRYAILYSARLALHIAIDKFLMGEMDMPSNEELKVSASNVRCLGTNRV